MISELSVPLILASSSASRASILKAAGLAFTAQPARLDDGATEASTSLSRSRRSGLASRSFMPAARHRSRSSVLTAAVNA